MATRTRRRIDRIKATVSITQLLSDFGYDVRTDGGDREQQIPCDLHGDGVDNKPSARVYPATASWYCFRCDKSRDAIETVRAKQNLGFVDAIKWLEEKYNLAPVPWEADDERPQTASEEVRQAIDPTKTFEDDRKGLYRTILGVTREKPLPMDDILAFWEAFDGIVYLVTEKRISEAKGRSAIAILDRKVAAALTQGYRRD